MSNSHKARATHARDIRNLSDDQLGKLVARASGRVYAAAIREMGRRGGLSGQTDFTADMATVRAGSADMRPVRKASR